MGDTTQPHRDVEYDPDGEFVYECLECGERLVTTDSPVGCPECDSTLRNCGMPIE